MRLPTFSIVVVCIICATACQQELEYNRFLEKNYNKGARNDSLFLGYHFGMSKEEFYDHSWSLNRQKIVRQGENNQTVRYEVDELKSKAYMNFYPVFNKDSIYSMPVKYSYAGWAPWNRELWADSLEQELIDLYRDRYKGKFKKMIDPETGKQSHIMIRDNKQISIYQMDDNRHVAVVYTDLNVSQRLKNDMKDDKN